MKVQLTDAHAHIRTKKEAEERVKEGILTLACGTNPKEAQLLRELSAQAGGMLIPTFGLHPWYSNQYNVEEMLPYFELCPIIGEIGMDNVWCDVPLSIQQEVFEQQLAMAARQKKPVILHTKGQEQPISRIIRQYPNTYLVHWYSCMNHLEEYLEQDCYFSIGPDAGWNEAVRRTALLAPLERILIETDGMEAVDWAWKEGAGRGGLRPDEAPEAAAFAPEASEAAAFALEAPAAAAFALEAPAAAAFAPEAPEAAAFAPETPEAVAFAPASPGAALMHTLKVISTLRSISTETLLRQVSDNFCRFSHHNPYMP